MQRISQHAANSNALYVYGVPIPSALSITGKATSTGKITITAQ